MARKVIVKKPSEKTVLTLKKMIKLKEENRNKTIAKVKAVL